MCGCNKICKCLLFPVAHFVRGMTVGELGHRLVLSKADEISGAASLVQTAGLPDPGEGARGRLLGSRALTLRLLCARS